MHRIHSLAFLTLLASPLAAQQLIETFTYPNGPTVPGWTPRSGTWTIANNRLVKTSGAATQFLTRDGINVKNSVMDMEVFYGATPGVQFAGLVSRHPGTTATSPLIYCKIQDNGGTADLDRCFIYENGGAGAIFLDVVPPVQSAIIRLITLDAETTMLIDRDKDGNFDQTLGPKPVTVALTAGQIGITAYQTTEMDNFKYYDGVLVPKAAAVPKIGTTFNMRFATPAPQNTVWMAGFALKNTGVPLGNRAVPLALDPLLELTLGNAAALGLTGMIDANGDGHLAFPIPNNPVLVGFGFYAAAFTIDSAMPFSIGVISADVRVVVQA